MFNKRVIRIYFVLADWPANDPFIKRVLTSWPANDLFFNRAGSTRFILCEFRVVSELITLIEKDDERWFCLLFPSSLRSKICILLKKKTNYLPSLLFCLAKNDQFDAINCRVRTRRRHIHARDAKRQKIPISILLICCFLFSN